MKMLETLWQRVLPVFTEEFWAEPLRAPMISRSCRHLVWGVCLAYIPLVILLQRMHDRKMRAQKQGSVPRARVGPVLKAITCLWNVLLCIYCFAGFCALVSLEHKYVDTNIREPWLPPLRVWPSGSTLLVLCCADVVVA